MTTIGSWLQIAEQELALAEIGSARLDALILLETATGRSREDLLANSQEQLRGKAVPIFRNLIDQRKSRVPLAQITKTKQFYGIDLEINPDVLTPRTETEQMVDWAIQYTPPGSHLIDIGTGSGAIAIAIAQHRPDLKITATEISATALNLAQRNANRFSLSINFIQSDLFTNVTGTFSTVVTNLPYLKNDADLMPEVTKEPAVALFGGTDGLDTYRHFFKQLPQYLDPNGFVFTESDPWQQPPLIDLAGKSNLVNIEQGYFILGFQLK